jgi:hypothetical protein
MQVIIAKKDRRTSPFYGGVTKEEKSFCKDKCPNKTNAVTRS